MEGSIRVGSVFARLAAFVCAVGFLVFAPVSVANAGEAVGCSATVTSINASGETLGVAYFPGDGATSLNPLPIDPDGSVSFNASSPLPYTSGSWSVSVSGVTVADGDFTNPEGVQEFSAEDVNGEVPAGVASAITSGSIVPVEVSVSSPEGSCAASGYITGVTPATSSPILYAGAALVVTGTTMTGALLLSRVIV